MKFQPKPLILDLYMPAMDGFHVCRTLQSDPDTSQIHILAVSGYPSKENIRPCRRNHFGTKPASLVMMSLSTLAPSSRSNSVSVCVPALSLNNRGSATP
jgi:CheY-like chemotaxis protein